MARSAQCSRHSRSNPTWFHSRTLRPKPSGVDLAHGQHNVGVWVALLPVDVEVGHHSTRHELALYELPRQPDRLSLAQLLGQGEFDLARDLGVAPLLGRLGRVPQLLAIAHPFRRALG